MVDHGGHAGSALEPIIQVKAKTANDHKIPFLVNGAAEVSVGSIALSLVHRTVALRAVVRYRSPCPSQCADNVCCLPSTCRLLTFPKVATGRS